MERVIRGPEQLATIAIEGVRPDVDCGRYAVKRVVGDDVVVTADVFTHGHTELAVQLEYRHQTGRTWKSVPMRPLVNDRWTGSFPADRMGEYRFRIVAVARRARDLAARLRQEARGRRRHRPRPRRGCAPRGAAARSGRPRRDRAALETWIERLRGGLDRKAAESLDRLVTIGPARRRSDARDRVRRDVTGVGRPTARAELGVVRAVPALRVARPGPARDARRRDRPAAVRRGDGLRRAVPAADPPDRHDPPQGTEQRHDRARRRPGEPVGDRRGRRRAHRRASRPRDRRGRRTAGDRGPRASTSTSRSTSRSRPRPTIRGSPSIRSGSGTAPTARSRTPRTRRSATRTSTRSTSRPRTRPASGTRCSMSSGSGSSAAYACSASTTRTPSPSSSGSG